MRRQRFRLLALALAAVVGLTASGVGAVVLKGRGELHAYGSGLAVLKMRGVLAVRGAGVLIADEDAVVDVGGRGKATHLGDGRILFEGYGHALITSRTPTRIEIAGAHIRLHAKGAGKALLKGCGVISTDDLDLRWEDQNSVEFDSEGS